MAETTTEEFDRVMVTDALSPLRVIEALQGRVVPGGTIGVMSSGQGSDADHEPRHALLRRPPPAARRPPPAGPGTRAGTSAPSS